MGHKETKKQPHHLLEIVVLHLFPSRAALAVASQSFKWNGSVNGQMHAFDFEVQNLNYAINNHILSLLFPLSLQSCHYTTSTVPLAGDPRRLCATGSTTTRWI